MTIVEGGTHYQQEGPIYGGRGGELEQEGRDKLTSGR